MSPATTGLIGMGVLFLFLAARMPIGFAMALVGFGGVSYLIGVKPALASLGFIPYSTAVNYTLSVVPLFLLMGQFAFFSGLSRDAYYAAHRWLGHLPGGLAMSTIGGCAAFAAVSGSSLATAATMGVTALPEMRRYNYDPKLATGSIAAGGTLGILIPPSVAMVIYAILTEESVGKLLIAGILPGILLAFLFMLTIYIMARRNPALGPRAPKTTFKEKLLALKGAWGITLLFLLVMGGIYLGWFTPTEAAAVGALGSFLFVLAKRENTRKNIFESLRESGRVTAMIFAIIIGAMVYNQFLAVTRLPFELADWVAGLPLPRHGILVVILLIYIFLGMVMDTLAMILLTVPIVFPVVETLGFNLIWFGVIVVIMMEQALITPPIGMNVFVLAGVAKDVPMYTVFRGIVPFLIAMLIGLAIIVAFPQIATFLPNAMRG
ncbi:MAG: TRAP transporter large permease [Dehalococcoidia bacterium]